jgi:ATP phosphoribosyltransferase regulatory subunit HisZ
MLRQILVVVQSGKDLSLRFEMTVQLLRCHSERMRGIFPHGALPPQHFIFNPK